MNHVWWKDGQNGGQTYDASKNIDLELLADAETNGKGIQTEFVSLIHRALPVIADTGYNQQWIAAPKDLPGLFPNYNANYVAAFMNDDYTCMYIEATTPKFRETRPFYGYMAADYTTTVTESSLTMDMFGDWDQDYKMWACRNVAEAKLRKNFFENSQNLDFRSKIQYFLRRPTS